MRHSEWPRLRILHIIDLILVPVRFWEEAPPVREPGSEGKDPRNNQGPVVQQANLMARHGMPYRQ